MVRSGRPGVQTRLIRAAATVQWLQGGRLTRDVHGALVGTKAGRVRESGQSHGGPRRFGSVSPHPE